MGGVTEPVTEPPVVISPTTGNDTIYGGALTAAIDGLAGDDLLVLNYSGRPLYEGKEIAYVFIALYDPFALTEIAYTQPPDTFPNYGFEKFSITGFERLDFTASDLFSSRVIATDGNDTLRGGAQSDILNGQLGSNVIYGGAGYDSLGVTPDLLRDWIYGGDDDDTISGVGRNDIADGGAGNDYLGINLSQETVAYRGSMANLIQNPNWINFETYGLSLTRYNDVITVTNIPQFLDAGLGVDDLLIVNRTGLGSIDLETVMTQRVLPSSGLGVTQARNFERLEFTGGEGADSVGGTARDDTIYGGGGNDRLLINDAYGMRGGADLVAGGAGNDTIYGVGAEDTVDGGAGIDTAIVDFRTATQGISGRVGDKIFNLTGVEIVSGVLTNFDDVLALGGFRGELDAGAGNDTAILNYSTSTAAQGNYNFVNLGFNSGRIDFRNAEGYIIGDAAILRNWETLNITGSNQQDRFQTLEGNDTLIGLAGNDSFNAGLGRNLLFGGAGDDGFSGVQGASDTVYGDAGNDSFSNYDLNDILNGGLGIDTVGVNYSANTSGVRLSLHGLAGEWTAMEQIVGNLSNYDDVASLGAQLNGELYGGQGNDLLGLNYVGAASQVVMTTGSNFTSLRITSIAGVNSVTIFHEFEQLNLTASNGNDVLSGLRGSDLLIGLAGNDVLLGNDGNDTVYGGTENDTISGGAGDDSLYGGQAADYITAEGGDDLIYAGLGFDTVLAGIGDDRIYGEAGSDFLIGAIGNDTIYGGDGMDRMNGGDGVDVLIGGADRDIMVGGSGADIFVFDARLATGSDVIADYESIDTLYFRGLAGRNDLSIARGVFDVVITWDTGTLTLVGAARLVVTTELGDLFG
ncbi:MAG: calcium-binding protein [Cypionkella sp.]|uniref:calcium-binding protein n=1 Tax=Cypionkella sp. TaxID=2811411 RepID=UPI002ABA3B3A|nr:calcium-binding protein [Cypionkella sp.]MDZ4311744.1 calcium-binding protein [Cypionkella sp.]